MIYSKWTTLTGLRGETSSRSETNKVQSNVSSFWQWFYSNASKQFWNKEMMKLGVLIACCLSVLLCWISPTRLQLRNITVRSRVVADILNGDQETGWFLKLNNLIGRFCMFMNCCIDDCWFTNFHPLFYAKMVSQLSDVSDFLSDTLYHDN